MPDRFHPGDVVIYRKQVCSPRPGRHARNIEPAPHGDSYSYLVDKYWRVAVVQDNALVVLTRKGKRHTLAANDPNLRPARWWEKLLFRRRFPPPTPG